MSAKVFLRGYSQEYFQEAFDNAAMICILALAFLLLSGSKLLQPLAIIAVTLSLLFANHRDNILIISRSKPTRLVGLLGLLVLVGMLYTVAPLQLAIDNGLNKYSKFFYGVFLYPLFYRRDFSTKMELAFLAGVFFTYAILLMFYLFPSFFEQFLILFPHLEVTVHLRRVELNHHVDIIRFPIALCINLLLYSVFSGIASAMLLQRIFESTQLRQRLVLSILYAISIFYVVAVNGERTAMLLFLVGNSVVAYYYLGRYWAGVAALLSFVFVACIFLCVPVVHAKIMEIFVFITHLNQIDYFSSIGYRIGFWYYSWLIWKQHFIFGAGTGSFAYEYLRLGGPGLDTVFMGQKNIVHAHNMFLMIVVQFGLVGLIVLCSWLVSLWQTANRGIQHNAVLLKLMLVSLIVYGNCNVAIFSKEGIFFIIFMSALAASIERNEYTVL